MNYDGVAIEVTEKCPLHCEHCCQNSDLQSETMNKELSLEYIINKISEDSEIRYISLTGGEPFLCIESIKSAIKFASEKGMGVSAITSGFWAVDDKKTEDMITVLKELGLNLLTISRDEFHSKEVSDENIRRILRYGRLVDLRIDLQISVLNDTDFGKILNPLRSELASNNIEVYPVFYAGRAQKIDRTKFICNEKIENQFCGKGAAYLIDCKGNVYPCCSPLGKKTNFKLGNIRDTTSKEIREKLQKNFVLHILRNYGFDPFVDWANNNNIKLPDRITSSCDLCAMLFTERNMLKILNEQKYIKEKIKEKY